MRVDDLVAHGDDIQGVVGEFYGTPIRKMYTLAQELREIDDTQQRVRNSFGIEEPTPDVVLLPGEVVHDDIIRRDTTAEFIGEDFYEKETPEGRQVSLDSDELNAKGALVTWRPNNQDFAVIHEEVADGIPS